MNYLVTGASGFIGSFVVKELCKNKQNKVYCLVRPESNFFRLDGILDQLQFICIEHAEVFLKDQSIESCFHLAWDGVLNPYKNSEIQKVNLDFQDLLFDLFLKVKIKNVVAIGSQAEYGIKNKSIKETEALQPITLYGKEKVRAFFKLKEFCEKNEIVYQWIRVFSTYGPYDNISWLIPYVTLSYLKNEKPKLSRGIQKWDYLFVEDLAQALILASKFKKSGVYNIGSSSPCFVKEVVEKIYYTIMPSVPLEFGDISYGVDQIFHLEADVTLFKAMTNWMPKVDLQQGLNLTIDYYKKNLGAFC